MSRRPSGLKYTRHKPLSGVMLVCPCGNEFYCLPSRVKRTRCCSKKCQYKYACRPSGLAYNIKVKNSSWFEKGHQPAKPFPKGWQGGYRIKKGERLSPSTEFKKGQISHNYKGDAVGYHALHTWLRRKLGAPINCEHCGGNKNLEWANKSWTYQRDISDWIALCKKCHGQYDRPAWGRATQLYPELRK